MLPPSPGDSETCSTSTPGDRGLLPTSWETGGRAPTSTRDRACLLPPPGETGAVLRGLGHLLAVLEENRRLRACVKSRCGKSPLTELHRRGPETRAQRRPLCGSDSPAVLGNARVTPLRNAVLEGAVAPHFPLLLPGES